MVRGRNIPEEKISVIRNGIRLDKYAEREPPIVQKKRLELGIGEGHFVVGTVARLRKEKGVEYFIRSIPSILQEFPETIFIVVGDGPLKDEIEHLARSLGLAGKMKFLGFRSDVPDLLPIFDINVVPSLSEGLPLSLIEAMSVGNSIVATAVGGLNEVGEEGKTVLFVPPMDPKSIADKVCYLLKNKGIREALSNGAKAASREYDVEKNISALSDFYRKLLPVRE
jgi:glycosyltransferase involved in cell wall biosynthesis